MSPLPSAPHDRANPTEAASGVAPGQQRVARNPIRGAWRSLRLCLHNAGLQLRAARRFGGGTALLRTKVAEHDAGGGLQGPVQQGVVEFEVPAAGDDASP